MKDLFQNVNFGEKCKFCNIVVAKTCPEGPVKDLFQNLTVREKYKSCKEGPVKDLF